MIRVSNGLKVSPLAVRSSERVTDGEPAFKPTFTVIEVAAVEPEVEVAMVVKPKRRKKREVK